MINIVFSSKNKEKFEVTFPKGTYFDRLKIIFYILGITKTCGITGEIALNIGTNKTFLKRMIKICKERLIEK